MSAAKYKASGANYENQAYEDVDRPQSRDRYFTGTTEDSVYWKSDSGVARWKIVVGTICLVVLLAGIAALVAYFVLRAQKDDTASSSNVLTGSIRLTSGNFATYDPDLQNPGSEKYKNLANEFVAQMDATMANSQLAGDYDSTAVTGFQRGSVIVSYQLTFKKPLEPQNVRGVLQQQIVDSNNQLGNIDADPSSLQLSVPDSVGTTAAPATTASTTSTRLSTTTDSTNQTTVTCQYDISSAICSAMQYANKTYLSPAQQDEIALLWNPQLNDFIQGCWPFINPYLCRLLVPGCDGNRIGRLPCRSNCMTFTDKCKAFINTASLLIPDEALKQQAAQLLERTTDCDSLVSPTSAADTDSCVDIEAPPEEPSNCKRKISSEVCANLGYANYTNVTLAEQDELRVLWQDDVLGELQGCWHWAPAYTCRLFLPGCYNGNVGPLPCKQVCREFSTRCKEKLVNATAKLPAGTHRDRLQKYLEIGTNCDSLVDSAAGGECVTFESEPPAPACNSQINSPVCRELGYAQMTTVPSEQQARYEFLWRDEINPVIQQCWSLSNEYLCQRFLPGCTALQQFALPCKSACEEFSKRCGPTLTVASNVIPDASLRQALQNLLKEGTDCSALADGPTPAAPCIPVPKPPEPTCTSITSPVCRALGYAQMTTVSAEKQAAFAQLWHDDINPIIQQCWLLSNDYLCQRFVPGCSADATTILPCKSACQEFSSRCQATLTAAASFIPDAALKQSLMNLLQQATSCDDLTDPTSSSDMTCRQIILSEELPECKRKISSEVCSKMGYASTTNLTREEQATLSALWHADVQEVISDCWPWSPAYVCRLLVPGCSEGKVQPLPCRQACQEFSDRCKAKLTNISMMVPEQNQRERLSKYLSMSTDCDSFVDSTSNQECVSFVTDKQPECQRTIMSNVCTELGYSSVTNVTSEEQVQLNALWQPDVLAGISECWHFSPAYACRLFLPGCYNGNVGPLPCREACQTFSDSCKAKLTNITSMLPEGAQRTALKKYLSIATDCDSLVESASGKECVVFLEQEKPECKRPLPEVCSKLGYATTTNVTTAEQAQLSVLWQADVQAGIKECWPWSPEYACRLFVPGCGDGRVKPLPCRQACQEFSRHCAAKLTNITSMLPEGNQRDLLKKYLARSTDCDSFVDSTSSQECAPFVTNQQPECKRTIMSNVCSKMGYATTTNETSAEQAQLSVLWQADVQAGIKECWPWSPEYACRLFVPGCGDGRVKPLPCRQACLDFSDRCKGKLTNITSMLPSGTQRDLLKKYLGRSTDCESLVESSSGQQCVSFVSDQQPECKRTIMSKVCSKLGYASTTNVSSAEQAQLSVLWQDDVLAGISECWPWSPEYACRLFLPGCGGGKVKPLPCRQACHEFSSRCQTKLENIVSALPEGTKRDLLKKYLIRSTDCASFVDSTSEQECVPFVTDKQPECQRTIMSNVCSKLDYASTTNVKSEKQAELTVLWQADVQAGIKECWPWSPDYACRLFLPGCTDGKEDPPPCRQACQEFSARCKAKLTNITSMLPAGNQRILLERYLQISTDCDSFVEGTSGQECVSFVTDKQPECQRTIMSNVCTRLGYAETTNVTSAEQTYLNVLWQADVLAGISECWYWSPAYACRLFLPGCNDGSVGPLPCREACQEFSGRCRAKLTNITSMLPEGIQRTLLKKYLAISTDCNSLVSSASGGKCVPFENEPPSPQQCGHSIESPVCRALGYATNTNTTPALQETYAALWIPFVNDEIQQCWGKSNDYLCQRLVPGCSNGKPRPLPCRETCEAFKKACYERLTAAGQTIPDPRLLPQLTQLLAQLTDCTSLDEKPSTGENGVCTEIEDDSRNDSTTRPVCEHATQPVQCRQISNYTHLPTDSQILFTPLWTPEIAAITGSCWDRAHEYLCAHLYVPCDGVNIHKLPCFHACREFKHRCESTILTELANVNDLIVKGTVAALLSSVTNCAALQQLVLCNEFISKDETTYQDATTALPRGDRCDKPIEEELIACGNSKLLHSSLNKQQQLEVAQNYLTPKTIEYLRLCPYNALSYQCGTLLRGCDYDQIYQDPCLDSCQLFQKHCVPYLKTFRSKETDPATVKALDNLIAHNAQCDADIIDNSVSDVDCRDYATPAPSTPPSQCRYNVTVNTCSAYFTKTASNYVIQTQQRKYLESVAINNVLKSCWEHAEWYLCTTVLGRCSVLGYPMPPCKATCEAFNLKCRSALQTLQQSADEETQQAILWILSVPGDCSNKQPASQGFLCAEPQQRFTDDGTRAHMCLYDVTSAACPATQRSRLTPPAQADIEPRVQHAIDKLSTCFPKAQEFLCNSFYAGCSAPNTFLSSCQHDCEALIASCSVSDVAAAVGAPVSAIDCSNYPQAGLVRSFNFGLYEGCQAVTPPPNAVVCDQPVLSGSCSGLGWSSTFKNATEQQAAAALVDALHTSLAGSCSSPYIRPLLCAAYVPQCHGHMPKLPCRENCYEMIETCGVSMVQEAFMNIKGEKANCLMFHEKHTGKCVDIKTLPKP